jgi:PhoPQ-activated pathogenicity-related protein
LLTFFFRNRFHVAVFCYFCLVSFVVGAENVTQRTALDDYIAKPDSTYTWKLSHTKEAADHTVFGIELTSQTWRTPEEVDRPVWKHWLMVVCPKVVESKTGFLFITGGSHRDTPPDVEGFVTKMAMGTKSIVAELKNVPNQALVFKDGGRPMVEDDLITFTWNKYIETRDKEWPARLPMVKSAVRAMDALQAFAPSKECGNRTLDNFVVAGGSKRGWTTWCTAAVDPRVIGICPAVIDVVNVRKSMRNHLEGYGFWAPSVGDYVRGGLTLKENDPAYIELLEIEDPYVYRDRYTMPKMVLNAAGDQFFTPDSSRFYYHDLPGEKLLRYVPNTDHSLRGSDGRETMAVFYDSIIRNLKRPKYSWTFLDNGAIRVDTPNPPKEVKLWQAHNPKARDFRLEEVGPIYQSTSLKEIEPGVYVGSIDKPIEGYKAFFVELTYDIGSSFPLKVTTDVRILPEVLPFKGIPATDKIGGAALRQ